MSLENTSAIPTNSGEIKRLAVGETLKIAQRDLAAGTPEGSSAQAVLGKLPRIMDSTSFERTLKFAANVGHMEKAVPVSKAHGRTRP